jgi:putative glutamine amidotransferase
VAGPHNSSPMNFLKTTFCLRIFLALFCSISAQCGERVRVGLFYNQEQYDQLMHGKDFLTNYTSAIEENGGQRIALSPRMTPDQTAAALGSIDRLLIPGGADIDPKFYGEKRRKKLEEPVDAKFDQYELDGVRHAKARGIPILGICRGFQILNVEAGGTLYQDLPTELGTNVTHRIYDERGNSVRCTHYITISDGSALSGLFMTNRLEVNSYHHQGVHALGQGFKVIARTGDGLPEAIENREKHVLGVQFHPEKDRRAIPLFNNVFSNFIGQPVGAKGDRLSGN